MNQRTRRDLARAPSAPTDSELRAFHDGQDFRLYRSFGAHGCESGGVGGVQFRVWAPGATSVSVIGDFNQWSPHAHPMRLLGDSGGVWECFVAGVPHAALYKYRIESPHSHAREKSDPFARACEMPPADASKVWLNDYEWGDRQWMHARSARMSHGAPWTIYELHLGSWRRDPAQPERLLNYRELAAILPSYLEQTGFTHVALLPLAEYANSSSWGYCCTSFFAPTARYGSPDDLRALVDALHRQGIGVLLDWTPAAFAADAHGLDRYDGTELYERPGSHGNGNHSGSIRNFNYERGEVRAFVGSSALYWLDEFHIDGLRFVGLPSMLRRPDGSADADAIALLRSLNDTVRSGFPDVRTIADDASTWAGVTRPESQRGLGFSMAWCARSVHNMLEYLGQEPWQRRQHHALVTAGAETSAGENCILPLSHDEVAPGRGSLIERLPGDDWQRFATLRLLYGYQWTVPGKKLLFMGGEFAQRREWQPDISLDWHELDEPSHGGIHRWVGDLNRLLREHPALYSLDFDPAAFDWLARDEAALCLVAFERRGPGQPPIAVICNFTPRVHENFRIGVNSGGAWREILNSDAEIYGGSGVGNFGGVETVPVMSHGRFQSIVVTVPPLAMIVLEQSTKANGRSRHDRG
jgi:1,4-alpha-glucan branching enzyme